MREKELRYVTQRSIGQVGLPCNSDRKRGSEQRRGWRTEQDLNLIEHVSSSTHSLCSLGNAFFECDSSLLFLSPCRCTCTFSFSFREHKALVVHNSSRVNKRLNARGLGLSPSNTSGQIQSATPYFPPSPPYFQKYQNYPRFY